MKTKSFSLKTILTVIAMALLLSGCNNFLNGGDLLEQLQEKISYENAPTLTVNVRTSYGSVLNAGDNILKKSDKLTLLYTEGTSGYQFVKWNVTPEGTVSFSKTADEQSSQFLPEAEITVTADDIEIISIYPEVYIRPALDTTKSEPAYVKTGVPKNSSIYFTFSQKLSPNNDVSKISINLDDGTSLYGNKNDADNYFTTATIDEYSLVITNNGKMLDVDKTQKITVTIPGDFYYETADGSKIFFGNDAVYSYIINNETREKAEININAGKGSISPAGLQNYSIGSSFSTEYTKPDEYDFRGWSITAGDGYKGKEIYNTGSTTSGVIKLIKYDTNGNEIAGAPVIDLFSFTDPAGAEYELLKAQNIYKRTFTVLTVSSAMISPAVYVRPFVDLTKTEPPVEKNGVPKNSSIYFTFSQKLSPNNDVSKIKVTLDDGTQLYGNKNAADNYFSTATISDYNITIASNGKLLKINDIQKITVTIPGSFFYETSDGNKICFGSDIVYTYNVNNETNEKIEININTEAGNITPNGVHNYSIGETFSIEYIMLNGFNFNGWIITAGDEYYGKEVFNANSTTEGVIQLFKHNSEGAEIPESKIDLFKFTTPTASESELLRSQRTFRRTFTVLTKVNGVLIKPDGRLIPKMEDYTPKYVNTGDDYDTPVIIAFNKEIDAATLIKANLSIKNNVTEDDLANYFTLSQSLENGKTILTLKPDYAIKEKFETQNSKIDIAITLDKTKIKDPDGQLLEGTTSWYYRVKNEAENVKPKATIEVFKDSNCTKKITNDSFIATDNSAWVENIPTNHVGKTVWIKVTATDEGTGRQSGVKELKVIETQKCTALGNEFYKPSATYYEGTNSFTKSTNASNETVYSATIPYTFYSTQGIEGKEDGVIELILSVVDYAGNESSPVAYYPIKDTIADKDHLFIWNTLPEETTPESLEYNTSYEDFCNKTKEIYFDLTDVYLKYKNATYFTELKNYKIVTGLNENSITANKNYSIGGCRYFKESYDFLEYLYDGEMFIEWDDYIEEEIENEQDYNSIEEEYSYNYTPETKETEIHFIRKYKRPVNKFIFSELTSNTPGYISISYEDDLGNASNTTRIIPASGQLEYSTKTEDYNHNPQISLYWQGALYQTSKRYLSVFNIQNEAPFIQRIGHKENLEQAPFCIDYSAASDITAFYIIKNSFVKQQMIDYNYETVPDPCNTLYSYPSIRYDVTRNLTEDTSIPLPENYTLELLPGEKNSYTIKGKLTIPETEKQEGYSYALYVKQHTKNYFYTSSEFLIPVEKGITYNFDYKLRVTNNETKQYRDTDLKQEPFPANTEFDTIPPELDISSSQWNFNRFILINTRDFESELKINENNNYEVMLYFIPWKEEWLMTQTSGNFITKEEAENECVATAICEIPKFNDPKNPTNAECNYYCEIPVLEPAQYLLAAEVFDKNNNSTFIATEPYLCGEIEKYTPTYEINRVEKSVSSSIPEILYEYDYFIKYCTFNPASKKWVHQQYGSNSNNIQNYTESNTYLKCELINRINDYSIGPYYTQAYTAPAYYYTGDPTCTTAKMSALSDKILLVESNKPALIHTFYSRTEYEKNADLWTLNCQELQPEQTSGIGISFYEIPSDKIESGCYYITICHFADGTTVMTDVVQKP